ncbi:Heparinase II/III family protein [Opitutaceae bacterium TAV5]|nr:Heparinase II/III family protein [Opitutaceae bacterium TAV5]
MTLIKPFAFTLLVAGICISSGTTSDARPLLPDGGFEQGGKAWAHSIPPEAKDAEAAFDIVTDNPHSGTYAARLSSAKPARHGFGAKGSQAAIPVSPGERYRLSTWVRADENTQVRSGTPGLLVRLTLSGADKKDAPGGHYYAGLGNWLARDSQPPAASKLPVEWTQIDVVLEIPSDAAWASPSFFAWRAQGAVYFDDVVFEKVASDTPLSALADLSGAKPGSPNLGFEEGASGWTHFIPADSHNAEARFTVTSDRPHSGTQAARLYSASPARHGIHHRSSVVKVTAGEHWKISVWVRADSDTKVAPGTAGVSLRLTLKDAAGRDVPEGHYFVGLGNWVGRNLEPPASASIPVEWTKMEVVVKIPPDVSRVIPTLFVWRAQGAVYFDDVVFEKVAASVPVSKVSESRQTGASSAPKPSAPPARELLAPDTQRELFSVLNLDLPELAGVKEAVGRARLDTAITKFAAYLRSRTHGNWLLDPFDPAHPDPSFKYREERANSGAIGRITPSGLAELWHTFPGNVIDWYHNETRHRPGLAYNQEWQYQLCRMSFWGDMANAYRATGDEKYPKAWAIQFRSFMAQCPPPETAANYRDSTWRTIECGIRMRDAWPRAFQAFVRSPSVTDEDLLLYVYSNLQHARYLKKFPSGWGNWLTMEMCGLHTIGTMFPEFKDAADWRRSAIDTMHASISRQFLPDGAQYELAPGYHIVSLDENGMAIPRLARATGRLNEIPADYIKNMEKGYDYLVYLMTPDRSEPRFNDSWPITWLSNVLNNGLLFFPERKDWAWIATDGAVGHPPSKTSHAFPYAGYFVMRSGWETDANYLAFDVGLPGYAHSHQDKLNLVFWVYGREILFDGGGGSYEDSKWRQYATDAFSHNIILVDGMPQRRQLRDREANVARKPVDAVWESTGDYDFAAATYDDAFSKAGMWAEQQPRGPVTHTRRILFSKPDLVIVADTLVPTDPADTRSHSYEARWHLLPTRTVVDPSTQAVTTAEPGLSNLAVIPLDTRELSVRAVSAQTEPELLGWHVRKDMDPQYVPATTVTHTRGGSGIQTFLTLLYPLRPGEENPVKAVAAINATDTRITLADGRQLRVHAPSAPKEKITLVRE